MKPDKDVDRSGDDLKQRIESIYEKFNPSKLNEVEGLLLKYAGKETDLLKAIEKKYGVAKEDDYGTKGKNRPWRHVLKNYTDDKFKNKELTASLEPIMDVLDEMATDVGGTCAEVIVNGQRKLVVKQSEEDGHIGYRNDDHYETVKRCANRMRELVHDRFEYNAVRRSKSVAQYQSNESDRRREDKRDDRNRKKNRDRKRR